MRVAFRLYPSLGGEYMIFDFIRRFIYGVGKATEKKTDTYEPKYDGQWRNKGSDFEENWQWVEKSANKNYKINVFQLEDDYIFTIGYKRRPNAIETVECSDDRELEIALDLLKAYYGTLGNVIIDTAGQ